MEDNLEYRKRLASERRVVEFYDRKALEMIAQRFNGNERIAGLKHDNGIEICDPAREAELIRGMEREFRHLPPGFVRDYYNLILRYSKEIMQGVFDDIESSR